MSVTLTRTTVNLDMIGYLLDHSVIAVDVLRDGEWEPTTELSAMYEAAINALISQARRDGLQVWSGDSCIEIEEATVCPGNDPDEA